MRQKSPSELNTKTIRINIGDYLLLTELSRRAGVTMAEALRLVLHRLEPEKKVSPTQVPMPVWTITPRPVKGVEPRPVITVNGNKHVAIRIKPKGGVIQ